MDALITILGFMTLAGTALALYLAGLEVGKEVSRRKINQWKNNE